MSSFTAFDDCRYRTYFSGCKIRSGDDGYPCSAWGHYLPGDEPGNRCTETESDCSGYDEIDLEECPRMEKNGHSMPRVFRRR